MGDRVAVEGRFTPMPLLAVTQLPAGRELDALLIDVLLTLRSRDQEATREALVRRGYAESTARWLVWEATVTDAVTEACD